jgi:hypothetical protein
VLPSSPIAELKKLLPKAQIDFDPGQSPAEAALLAKRSDLVIVFGIRAEGEGFDLPDLSLPWGQDAVIEAVAKVTHIADADARGEIIGSPLLLPGVIKFPVKQWNLCAGITNARYATTTEVYPDSPRATPQQCNDAQVAAVRAAIDYALAHLG